MCGLKRKPGHNNLMEGYRLVSPHPWCRLSELFLPVKRKNSSDSSLEVKLGLVHTNPDNFERGYIFLHESAFCARETSESGHRNRIALKPFSSNGLRLLPRKSG